MRDIKGLEIKIGQTVKTQQPSGGILPPATAQIGKVCYKDFNNGNFLCIKYRNEGQDFDRYITLEGKINEVLLAECYYCFDKVKPSVMDVIEVVCAKCCNEQMREEWRTDVFNSI
jgi:hypothetical protein